jgi:hypothetical protein
VFNGFCPSAGDEALGCSHENAALANGIQPFKVFVSHRNFHVANGFLPFGSLTALGNHCSYSASFQPILALLSKVPNTNKQRQGVINPRATAKKVAQQLARDIVVVPAFKSKQQKPKAKSKKSGKVLGGPFGRQPNFPSGTPGTSRRGTIITEDEYIADVNGSVAFAITQFPLNPGQASTFPWLSKEAQQWEKYRFLDLEFYYRPEVSAYATNGQSGKIIFQADYDASDLAPTTKQSMLDTVPHADSMPYEQLRLKLSPYEMHTNGLARFIRPGLLPPHTDIKTYDAGNLNVATIGNTNTTLIGELHVRYTVELTVPVLEPAVTYPPNTTVAQWSELYANTFDLTSGVSTVPPFNHTVTNGIGATNVAGVITPPAGNYIVSWWASYGGQNIDNTLTLIQKNGNAYTDGQYCGLATTATGDCTVAGNTFMSLSGTDTFNLLCTASFLTGTAQCVGQLMCQLI